MKRKKVKIKIVSKSSDIVLADMFTEIIDEFDSDQIHGASDAVNNSMVYSTEGTLEDDGSNIELSYEESADLGMDGCKTKLMFSKLSPHEVTMVRNGIVNTGMVFNPAKSRQLCMYETPYMPVEFCIFTHKVSNNLTYNGGNMFLDYDIEVQGVKTERNMLKVEVTVPVKIDGAIQK